jgi:hypothetical protein
MKIFGDKCDEFVFLCECVMTCDDKKYGEISRSPESHLGTKS